MTSRRSASVGGASSSRQRLSALFIRSPRQVATAVATTMK